MLLIAWAIGSVLISSPFTVVDQQVNNSVVLGTLDKVMPAPAKTMFSEFRRMLASGPFPQVFSDIGAAHLFPVQAPDPAVLNSPGYQAAKSRVVKVQGTAPSCDRSIEGSGFVYAPDHVLTNAHVVAGVTQGPVVTTPDGATYRASVVFYDPQVDIAVLYVPGLNMTPLQFAGQAQNGANAVVAGYPLDHSFTAVAARIGGMQSAVGPDIYQTGQVTRQIYEIKAVVEPGNSGGPLLSPSRHRLRRGLRRRRRHAGHRVRADRRRGGRRRERRGEADLPRLDPGLRLAARDARAEREQQAGRGHGRQAVSLDPVRDVVRARGHEARIDAGRIARVAAHSGGAAAEQGHRAAGVPAARVREADRDLGQAPPELTVRRPAPISRRLRRPRGRGTGGLRPAGCRQAPPPLRG